MTGRRLVSLPFSDHCEPLVDDSEQFHSLIDALTTASGHEGRYIEMRPATPGACPSGFTSTATFCLHVVDLRPDLDSIASRFHRSQMQRAIRKAERTRLDVATGSNGKLLESFYALHTLTRSRHGAPVQPLNWFRHLLECLGDSGKIWLAKYEGTPAAAIMTAEHKTTLVYKYGCSDAAYHRYGVMPFLFWRAIQFAKQQGLAELDLGRSDLDNRGLISFKDHFGGERRSLTYYRYTARPSHSHRQWQPAVAQAAYSLIPRTIQAKVGGHFYKHFA